MRTVLRHQRCGGNPLRRGASSNVRPRSRPDTPPHRMPSSARSWRCATISRSSGWNTSCVASSKSIVPISRVSRPAIPTEDSGRTAMVQTAAARSGLPRCHGTKDGARFSVRVIYFGVKAVEGPLQRFLLSKAARRREFFEFRAARHRARQWVRWTDILHAERRFRIRYCHTRSCRRACGGNYAR